MPDETENKPVEPAPMEEDTRPLQEEFPENLYCPQCRRMYPVKGMRAKSNTLLTEAALVCPHCRRKLRRMKLKDWYDHYVQGQVWKFTLDTHGFLHRDPAGEGAGAVEDPDMPRPQPPSRGPQDRNARPPQENRGRNPGRNSDRNRGRDTQQDQQKPKSRLPQNVKAYRLPKRRRSRER